MIARCAADSLEYGTRLGNLKPIHLLKSYQGFVNDFVRNDDAYKLEYHVGDSYRFEQRTDSGEVTGAFAFVAPEGNEYEFKYEADSDGFKVEGDALPTQPDYTDDVKAARDAFFESDENEESSESSEEDSDEESSESESESDSESEEDAHFSSVSETRQSSFSSPAFSVPYPYSRS